jgi:hypothetical protein
MRSILVSYQYKIYATTVPNSLIAVERENCSLYCSTEYYTEVHLHCFLRKLWLGHDSSLSKYRKQKQSPLEILKMAHVQGGDCFCLRYLLSDESWRIELTQKAMEMDFCVLFCDCSVKYDIVMPNEYGVMPARNCIYGCQMYY